MWTNTGIFFEIVDKGNYCLVRIADAWQDTTGKNADVHILTFEKQFASPEHAKAFTNTAMFKAVLRAVTKNFKKI